MFGREAFKKIFFAAGVPLIILAAAATPASARKRNLNEIPRNDSVAMSVVNRAVKKIRTIGPDAVAAARSRCVSCGDDQVVGMLIDVKPDSFYRSVFNLDGNELWISVLSGSTMTHFQFAHGRRTCTAPGVGGCPDSGVWGDHGFSIKLTSRGAPAR